MATMRSRAVRWMAPVALVGAVGIVACGDDSDETTVRQAGPAVSAEVSSGGGLPNPWEAGNRAVERALAADSTGDDCVPGQPQSPLP